MKKLLRAVKRLFSIFILIITIGLSVFIAIDRYVVISTLGRIVSMEDALNAQADCILVLGAGVRSDGSPSPMLRDRITTGVALYNTGVSDRILMSGDHTTKWYDEVNIMKRCAVEMGVPSENIFMDHAGISTYDSVYRAKEIFAAEKIVIVTQRYHLHRALYIAKRLGVEAIGVSADVQVYAGQEMRELREMAARVKDFFKAILKPPSQIGGELIPVSGNGDDTNDR